MHTLLIWEVSLAGIRAAREFGKQAPINTLWLLALSGDQNHGAVLCGAHNLASLDVELYGVTELSAAEQVLALPHAKCTEVAGMMIATNHPKYTCGSRGQELARIA